MFYIIKHPFLRHRLRVMWANWTTEEPLHCTAHNKQFKQYHASENPSPSSVRLKKTCTCLIHLFSRCPFGCIIGQPAPRRKNNSRYVSAIWSWIIVVINDLWVLTGVIWWTSDANSATPPICYRCHHSHAQNSSFKDSVITLVWHCASHASPCVFALVNFVALNFCVCVCVCVWLRCVVFCSRLAPTPLWHTHKPVQSVWTCSM